MKLSILKILFLLTIAAAASPAFAQVDASNQPMEGTRRGVRNDPDLPDSFKEAVAKRRTEQEKKEYEEMLERAESARVIAEEIETSYEQTSTLSKAQIKKIAELEKLVSKIRRDLGGDDDDDEELNEKPAEDQADVKTQGGAVRFIRASTEKLVDELKRSTRFSISVVAIQTSNAVIRVAKFLRLRN
ncbi:MAG: hypothetical protein QUS14_18170 [Pyrinomonadaceae bacterium]|nr:hypothetical protein [Pyrinomonadaceae bacterium]